MIKRVLFECADCFLPLFYIAFYQFDVEALRNELIGLFYSEQKIFYVHLLLNDLLSLFTLQPYIILIFACVFAPYIVCTQ